MVTTLKRHAVWRYFELIFICDSDCAVVPFEIKWESI